MKLLDIIGEPSVSLVTGARGKGKTACGTLILQEAHEKGYGTFIVGLPSEKHYLLPDYIKPLKDPYKIPDNSATFFDESYMTAYARQHQKEMNQFLARSMGVSRQKSQVLIFSTHTLRKLDVGVIMDADALILRLPGWLHTRYERDEIREFTREAKRILLTKDNPVEWAFIITDKGRTLVRIPLPEFWSDELSNAFEGVEVKLG